jgi:hypothetical protein
LREKEREKVYFDKRSPLINYIVEATIVYSTSVVLTAVAREKDQTTTTTSSISSRRQLLFAVHDQRDVASECGWKRESTQYDSISSAKIYSDALIVRRILLISRNKNLDH